MAKKNNRPSMAARKKVEEKLLAEKLAKRRAFFEKYKKQLLIAAAAAVAAILVIALAWDFFYVPNGSLRTFMGEVQGIQPNSLVRNIDGLYYEVGRMDAPEGYVAADYGVEMNLDKKEQNLYFENTVEGAAVSNVYVAAVANRTGSDMVKLLSQSGMYEVAVEGLDVQVGDHTVNYVYCQNPANLEEENPEEYYAMLVAYVDNGKGACIMVNATSANALKDALPTEEAMAAELEVILESLTINK